MKKTGLLNPALCSVIASIGHTDTLVIADAGLPLPEGIPVVDLSLIRGVPSFIETLKAIQEEFVIESFTLADEMEDKNKSCHDAVRELLTDFPCNYVSHEAFKRLCTSSRTIIRTGETTPYANIILTAGVNF